MSARKLKASEKLSLASRYELLLCLASGGMGTVYLGVRRGTSDVVAIKRAHAHLLEAPQFRKMFVAEAELASRINHPNAIGIMGVDESDGELLMVMRYVRGGSLSDLLSANAAAGLRLPIGISIRMLIDAARGLHGAHSVCDPYGRQLGIIHRDVSPQNILVGVDGTTAIVDFGVAKTALVDTTRSASDILKGKLAYMAPEYLSKRAASPQSDVFSLGVVAWEVLANERLFKGEDEVETMLRILDPARAPFLSERVGLDPGVSAIIARAVAKDPAMRFASAAEFADALEQKADAVELNASRSEVGALVSHLLGDELSQRDHLLNAMLRPQLSGGVQTGSMPQQRPAAVQAALPSASPSPVLYAPQRVSPTLDGAPTALGAAPTALGAAPTALGAAPTALGGARKASVPYVVLVAAVVLQLAVVSAVLFWRSGSEPRSTSSDPVGPKGATSNNPVGQKPVKIQRSSEPTPSVAVITQRLERAGFQVLTVTRLNRSNPYVIIKRADQPADTESIMTMRGGCTGLIYRYAPADDAMVAWALGVEGFGSKAYRDGVLTSVFTWTGDDENPACTSRALMDIATGTTSK